MTLPTNVNFGWVTGTFMDLAGTLCSGTVTFTATPTRILDATATAPTTIVPQPITASLSGGTFSQKLVATDDTDLNPSGFTYTVTFALLSGTTPLTVDPFSISVPTSDSSHALDLTIYTPVASANGVTYTRGVGVPDTTGATNGQAVILVDGVPAWADQTGTGGGGGGGPIVATDITDSTTVGRSVLTANNGAAARTAIGAGTSSLALGTTSTTALAGNTVIPTANIYCIQSGATYPGRPANTLPVIFVGNTDPTTFTGGTTAGGGGFVNGLDFWAPIP